MIAIRSIQPALSWQNIIAAFWIPLGLLALVLASPVRAMDTGHHSDLSYEVLQERGFGETAIKVVQVQNWLTDYFSSSPTSKIENDMSKLHFDNLFSTEQIRNYWGRLAVNMRNAVQQAAREQDTLKALTLLGISLHALQDFYVHSNWVETHPATDTAFRTDTWFTAPPALGSPNQYTGAYPQMQTGAVELHGDYANGLNKDSYVRPRWDCAYVFAYAASRQWVAAVQKWIEEIDPKQWEQMKTFAVQSGDRAALNYDSEAAYRISEWVAFSGQDGHWKGNGSGSKAEFAVFAAAWAATPDSRFVREFKVRAVHRLLSDGLTGDTPPEGAVPRIPRIALNRKAVILRTLQVAEKDDLGFFEPRIDSPGGRADFYARVTMEGQTFVEGMQMDKRSVSPFWTTIKFVPLSTEQISIRYELWDEDGGLAGDDDHCDINPARGVRDINFTFNTRSRSSTGDITGVHNTPETAVSLSGAKPDRDRAIVRFYITERPLLD